MRTLQDDQMDQTGNIRDDVYEDIMKKTKEKYDHVVNSSKWGAKFPDQVKIITLKAQVKELKDLKPQHSSSTS